jgi:uncharacterized heparinase superfamily protein
MNERSIFLPPWDALSDTELLAHYRAPRAVTYWPVADADETRPDKIEALMHGRFEFNGQTHALPDPIDWLANPSTDVEWHILLHKFYYAVGLGLEYERSGHERYAQRWVALIDGWMRAVPPGFIAADVTGRRVQNWIYSYCLFITHATHAAPIGAAWHRLLLESLHEQVEFLCEHLTPKRNHRTLELYAIFLAGVVFPEMRRAAHWREFALRETVANMASDLLPDGVHCELSTDYHHLALKNWLNFRRLAAANDIAVPSAMDAALERALNFSLHVHKPDGVVPSLSDGDARGFLDLLAQGAELFGRDDMRFVASAGAQGTPPVQRAAHFADSGYTVLHSGWQADAQYLVFDSGPLGEGNHGHFDALNFELAAFGRSLIVDPGRYTYSEAVGEDGINWRVHFRGTAAHNTVSVDGRQQTRYLPKPIKDAASRHATGSVRHKISGPPAEGSLVERFHSQNFDLLHGRVRSHECDALHERCIVFVDRRYWIVSDWLRAPTEHDYRLNFQLGAHAHGHTVLSMSDGGLRVRSPGLLIAQAPREGVRHTLGDAWVSARYGDKQPAPALRSHARACNAHFDTLLMPWNEREPVLHVLHELAVDAALPAPVKALRIELEADGQRFTDTWFHARDALPRTWRVGRFEFNARWLYCREAADGRVLRAASHAGAALQVEGRPFALDAEEIA